MVAFGNGKYGDKEYTVAILREMARYFLHLARQYEGEDADGVLIKPIRQVEDALEMLERTAMEVPELGAGEALMADALVMRMLLGNAKVPEAASLP